MTKSLYEAPMTATEVRQLEVEFWEKHKKSKSYLEYVSAEEKFLETILNRMLELAEEHMWYKTRKEAEEAVKKKEKKYKQEFYVLKDSEVEDCYWAQRKI